MTREHQDEIRAENAFLKLKLEMDHGMQASQFSGELTPAMENAWLHSILDFEKQLRNVPLITVFKHLGQPKYTKWDSLRLADVRRETTRLMELMRSRNVILEALKPVDDIEYYRFITEELFHEEVMFVPGRNMVLHFIYEEFKERENFGKGPV